MSVNSQISFAGVAFALTTAIALGAITAQAKLVYQAGGNAMSLMLIRFITSVLVLGLLALITRHKLQLPKSALQQAAAVGAVWSVAMICYLHSISTLDVSIAVIVLYSFPIVVMLWALITKRIAYSPAIIGLFGLAFGGLTLAMLGGETTLNSILKPGFLLAFIAALGSAYTFIKGAEVARNIPPLSLTFWVSLTGLVITLPLALTNFALPTGLSAQLALLGATLCYVLAIICQFQALSRLSAPRAALLLNLEPIVTLLLATFVLGEMLSFWQWSGAAVVLLVLFMSNRYLPSASHH